MQYNIGTPNIIEKYFGARAVNPIALPINVNGTIIAIILSAIDDIYTAFDAWLCLNGIFAVLIICIPTKFETILYVNQVV